MTDVPFCDLARALSPIRCDIDRAIARCIDRSVFLRGPEARAFEAEWAAYCGAAFAICCNSGTDALTIAARALELSTAAIPATTLPLTGIGLHRGGTSVTLADIGPDGWIEDGHPDAVPVLMHGMLPPLRAQPAALYDAAHAHGWKPGRAVAAWSFYPTKTLGALGDAGAVTTDDADVARALEALCGRDDRIRRPDQFTTRIDELQAAVLRVKLRHLDEWLEQRREIAAHYSRALGDLPLTLPAPAASLHHLYAIRVEGRDDLQRFLAEQGVETKAHWPRSLDALDGPWHRASSTDQARTWCDRTLSLPCFPGLRTDEIDRVCDLIGRWVVRARPPSIPPAGAAVMPPPR